MTYCLAIATDEGVVFASDSRTNAGVDYVSTFSKMHTFGVEGERQIVLLTAGNLATSQAVVHLIRRDIDKQAPTHLLNVEYLFEAARYIGALSQQVQGEHAEAVSGGGFDVSASFIIGGQIAGQEPQIFLVYPQGNYISAGEETPYLQIGESKYGKPILDRLHMVSHLSLEDAARFALLSIDSTMRSNLTVGPPIDLLLYRLDALTVDHRLRYKANSPYYAALRKSWNDSLVKTFGVLPRFDWET